MKRNNWFAIISITIIIILLIGAVGYLTEGFRDWKLPEKETESRIGTGAFDENGQEFEGGKAYEMPKFMTFTQMSSEFGVIVTATLVGTSTPENYNVVWSLRFEDEMHPWAVANSIPLEDIIQLVPVVSAQNSLYFIELFNLQPFGAPILLVATVEESEDVFATTVLHYLQRAEVFQLDREGWGDGESIDTLFFKNNSMPEHIAKFYMPEDYSVANVQQNNNVLPDLWFSETAFGETPYTMLNSLNMTERVYVFDVSFEFRQQILNNPYFEEPWLAFNEEYFNGLEYSFDFFVTGDSVLSLSDVVYSLCPIIFEKDYTFGGVKIKGDFMGLYSILLDTIYDFAINLRPIFEMSIIMTNQYYGVSEYFNAPCSFSKAGLLEEAPLSRLRLDILLDTVVF